MKVQDMTQRYRKFKRAWGTWYAFDNVTGNSVTLKTRVKTEADQKVHAMNESERQPHFNLSLARVYLNGADPKLATRTWQEVMENIVTKKTDETRRRWDTAIKDKNFDCIRKLRVAETRPEHFDKALADKKVSTNVYLRRIHNHALGMEWLLKSVIPRLQWPKLNFKAKRAITFAEHCISDCVFIANQPKRLAETVLSGLRSNNFPGYTCFVRNFMSNELTHAAMATWAAKDIPARLHSDQVAKILNCSTDDVAILASAGTLRALGRPKPNAVKFFSSIELITLLADRDWLDDATKTIGQFWRRKNARRNGSGIKNDIDDVSANDSVKTSL